MTAADMHVAERAVIDSREPRGPRRYSTLMNSGCANAPMCTPAL